MARAKSTDGRSYEEVGKFDNTAKNRSSELARGGAIGYPMETIGEETLRIMPEGGDLIVTRTHGADLVVRLVIDDGKLAQQLYDCLCVQVRNTGPLPSIKRWTKTKDKLSVVLQFGDKGHKVALLRGHQSTKVVEFCDQKPRSVARVANDDHGRQLFALLAGQVERAEVKNKSKRIPGSITRTRDEPTAGGTWDEAYGESRQAESTVQATLCEEDQADDDWNRLFH